MASPWRFGYSILGFFSGSPSGGGCSVLCFRHGRDVVLRDLPCSSVGGFHCAGPANARQIAWEKVIACGGGQIFLVRLGRRIVGGACHSYCHRLLPDGGIVDPSILLAPDAWARGCWLSVAKRSVLCPLGQVHSYCCSVSSL